MNGVANGVYGGDLSNVINTPWIDFSEQSTIVGWSSFTSKQMRYKILGKLMFIQINLEGTSNNTATTFTIPYPVFLSQTAALAFTANNNTYLIGGFVVSLTSNLIECYRPVASNNIGFTNSWTASATKAVKGQMIFEMI